MKVFIRKTIGDRVILRPTVSIMRRGLGTIFNLTMCAVYGNILMVEGHLK